MKHSKAIKLATNAVDTVTVSTPVTVSGFAVLVANPDGTYSTFFKDTEAKRTSREEAIEFIVKNLV